MLYVLRFLKVTLTVRGVTFVLVGSAVAQEVQWKDEAGDDGWLVTYSVQSSPDNFNHSGGNWFTRAEAEKAVEEIKTMTQREAANTANPRLMAAVIRVKGYKTQRGRTEPPPRNNDGSGLARPGLRPGISTPEELTKCRRIHSEMPQQRSLLTTSGWST